MRARYGVIGLLWLGLGCGDDGGGAGTDTGTTSDEATTIPLPTGASTTTAPGTTGTTTTVGPEVDTTAATTADTTSWSPDLPPAGTSDCERLEMLLVELGVEPDPDAQQALIDAFVEQVHYGTHGFPIAEVGKLAVVFEGAPGQSLSLAGDFNDWVPGEAPLVEAVSGFYYAMVDVAGTPDGLYKLVRDDEEFFADPLARRFGWDRFGEYSQVDALPDRSHHERYLGFEQGAGALQPRPVTVYLPEGAQAEAALPVIYMHDGQNLFSPEAFFGGWRVSETLDVAIGDGTLPPLVVVGIDNTPERFDEYTQVPDVLSGMRVGGRAEEYVDFLVDGIKPFVEARYPVASAPDQTAVMGSSLGGLVSLYIGLEHPEVFGQVASMSGTVAWGSLGAGNPTIIDAYAAGPPLGLRIYLDSGGSEGAGCPAGGSDNYCGNVVLADTLRAAGWVDEADLFYRWAPGAPHNELAWADRFLPALVDWFPGG